MTKNNEKKTCTYDVAKVKSYYYDAQKIQTIYDFLLKSPYNDARKSWKKHVLKTLLRQTHTTMMPKKYRTIMIFC